LSSAIITVSELRKVYRVGKEHVVALDNVNFTVEPGQVVCIVGTSGSGKSTLLNQLAGLEKPTRGSVVIGKRNISKMSEKSLARFRQKYVGFVFQSYNLMPSLSALENVTIPLIFKKVSKKKRVAHARAMLKAVGLEEREKHKPGELSGGQQQRVSIARAFISQPAIVFADEPTGNLDTKTTFEMMELITSIAKKNQQTLIIVTHDLEIAHYANTIIYIRDGNIEKIENTDMIKIPTESRIAVNEISN
jgi:putative ABC transport system ATP-binding protein